VCVRAKAFDSAARAEHAPSFRGCTYPWFLLDVSTRSRRVAAGSDAPATRMRARRGLARRRRRGAPGGSAVSEFGARAARSRARTVNPAWRPSRSDNTGQWKMARVTSDPAMCGVEALAQRHRPRLTRVTCRAASASFSASEPAIWWVGVPSLTLRCIGGRPGARKRAR
jgi:hypothetical protein